MASTAGWTRTTRSRSTSITTRDRWASASSGSSTRTGSSRARASVRTAVVTWKSSPTSSTGPDLYYRLSVFTIELPPLRERGDDLPMLVHHYLRRFGRDLGWEVAEVAPAAMGRQRDGSWPGNIREL